MKSGSGQEHKPLQPLPPQQQQQDRMQQRQQQQQQQQAQHQAGEEKPQYDYDALRHRMDWPSILIEEGGFIAV